jgi:basic amino acid/polyamine antiporter, APA family
MEKNNLPESLGLWTSVSLVIGGIIGSGIFMKPALMASQLGSPGLLILVWVVAGVVTMFGALTNAEIATIIPETGGQFIFFQKMYGSFFAFLYGWSCFAVVNTAAVASIAFVLAQYTEYFFVLPRFSAELEQSVVLHIPFIGNIFPLENFGVKALSVIVIVSLAIGNYFSVLFGGRVQVIFTILKVLAIILLVAGILFSGEGNSNNFIQNASFMPSGIQLVTAFVAALSGAFWAYDGWNNITFVAGEIRNPQKNIPLSLFSGLCVCILVYVLVNLAYLYVLPIESVAKSAVVATDAASVVVGSVGAGIIALLVIISTFGTTNGNLLATARVTFAMSRERIFFEKIGEVHPKYKTPGNAILLHCIWTSVLVFSGSFDTLTDMLIFVSWLFYGMSAFGVFVLRKKLPDVKRPYKVWGYPVVPAIFILFTVGFLGITLYTDITNYLTGKSQIINSLFGIALTFIGVPFYWYFKRKSVKEKEGVF